LAATYGRNRRFDHTWRARDARCPGIARSDGPAAANSRRNRRFDMTWLLGQLSTGGVFNF
jgi:hypothetical protein